MIKVLGALFILAFLLLGCSTYHFGHYKRALPGGYDRVAIPMFDNKSQEVGMETFFTNDLRTEFERSRLARVTSKSDAQVILEGTITSLTFSGGAPINNTSSDLKTPNPYPSPAIANPLPNGATLNKTYTANIGVKIVARKVSDNSVLWAGDFTGQRTYNAPLLGSPGLTSVSSLYNQSYRARTVESLAKDMMSEAHDRLTENF